MSGQGNRYPLQTMHDNPQRCEWFALCENQATHDEPHSSLGSVPCCDRCATLADPDTAADSLQRQADAQPGITRSTKEAPVNHGRVVAELAEYRESGRRAVVCELQDSFYVVECYVKKHDGGWRCRERRVFAEMHKAREFGKGWV